MYRRAFKADTDPYLDWKRGGLCLGIFREGFGFQVHMGDGKGFKDAKDETLTDIV